MKKVVLILILFLSCYYIYNKTIDEKSYYLVIGDSISRGTNEYGALSYGYSNYIKDYLESNKKLKGYNNTYTNNDYRIIDIIKVLEYNEKKDNISLSYLIKKADIITISLGMNEMYYKIEKDNYNIYRYIDNMINDYSKILTYIDKFPDKQVYVLGYYNILSKNNDLFEYANYKLKELCNKYNFTYIDLSKTLNNNPSYLNNSQSFIPNNQGYEKISQIIIEKIKNT